MRRLRHLTAFVLLGAVVLPACASGARPTLGDPVDAAEAPLPTIGIDSELGEFSDSSSIVEIDTGTVDSVVMVGDSITVGSELILEEQLETLGFAEVNVQAQELKRIGVSFGENPSGVDIVSTLSAGDQLGAERLWVVALGTNDISQYSSGAEVRAAVQSVLDSIPAEAPVVWINTYFADRPEDTAEVNDAIASAIRARDNAAVGRWDQVASTDGVLRSDGVHPNTEGSIVFASFVTSTVADFLQR